MITRDLEPALRQSAEWYPVVTVTGPRQAGKTTLVRSVFDLPYVSLEALDRRAEVSEDPRGFLAAHRDGAILDEVQHVPELLSYLQEEVDADDAPGRFVLTGSQHLGLLASVSQSLAGRTAVHHLHPLSLPELQRFEDAPTDLWDTVWAGGYPRIWDVGIPADRWLADYTATYVERDVRQVVQISDLTTFQRFLRLVAGRTAQEENLTAIGSDAGVARNTAASWLSVLEATFVAFRLPAWSANVRKRAVRASKLHLADTGLACHLLGITSADQLRHHPLRGPIFESWVAAEVRKTRAARGVHGGLHHYRETRGAEVDLVAEEGDALRLTEVKSGATTAGDWFDGLVDLLESLGDPASAALVYGGDRRHQRRGIEILPWTAASEIGQASR